MYNADELAWKTDWEQVETANGLNVKFADRLFLIIPSILNKSCQLIPKHPFNGRHKRDLWSSSATSYMFLNILPA